METKEKRQTKQQRAIELLINYNGAQLEEFHTLKFLRHSGNCVVVFRRGSPRPYANYRFRDARLMEEWIEKEKKTEADSAKRTLEYYNKAAEEAARIIPGAILYSSWGYEQTNIDFYRVLSRKGDFVMIQPIGKIKSFAEFSGRTWDDRGTCIPDPSNTGEPFRKKITKSGSITLNSFSYARLWDGKPLEWSSYA